MEFAYHPDALLCARLEGSHGDWTTISAILPNDSGQLFGAGQDQRKVYSKEFNAFGFVVWGRAAGSRAWTDLVGAVGIHDVTDMAGKVSIDFESDLGQSANFDPAGKEFLVAGVTKGDTGRIAGGGVRGAPHSEVSATIKSIFGYDVQGPWTLGTPTRVGASGAPKVVNAVGGDGRVWLSWHPVPGATDYRVRWGVKPDLLSFSKELGGPETTLSVQRLSNGVRYFFTVESIFDGSDCEASPVQSATPPPLLPPPLPSVVLAAPSVRSAAAEADRVRLVWGPVAGATAYEVRRGSSARVRVATTTHTFSGLDGWTSYRLAVRAVGSGSVSPWTTLTARTGAVVRGVATIRRITPTSTGYDLEFGFRPAGSSAMILPRLRFVKSTDLTVGRWLNSSPITRVVDGATQGIGRVSAGKQSDGRIRVCFTPAATGGRGCPSTHTILLGNMALNRWYATSTITVTVPSPTHPSSAVSAEAAALREAGDGSEGEPMGPG